VATDIKWEITSAKSLDKKREAQNKLNTAMPLEVADIRKWSEDLGFLLDEFTLRKEAGEHIFKNLNTKSVGVIGFSKGGAAAGQFCVSDERCTAGINLSGFMFGDAVNKNFKRPFMIMESVEEDCQECTPISAVLYENAENDAYMVRINGASHVNFTDFSLMFNNFIGLKGIGIGPINGHRFLQIQNHYVLSFFNQYLKGVPSDLLNGSAREYPEVIFSTKKTGVTR
jgi:predicted dienelactone hydrolase